MAFMIQVFADAYVAIEGFVVYTAGDYGLHPNVMLLVQVMGVRDRCARGSDLDGG